MLPRRNGDNGEYIVNRGVAVLGAGDGYDTDRLSHRRIYEDVALDAVGFIVKDGPEMNVEITVFVLDLGEGVRVCLRNGETADYVHNIGTGGEVHVIGDLVPGQDHNLQLQGLRSLGEVGVQDP